MKKTIAILLISLMLFTSGCAVMTAAAPEPTPAPPTVEELLADALKYTTRATMKKPYCCMRRLSR